jgi:transposase
MFELTDQAFTRLQPLLAANSRCGRPCRDHRQVLGGIIWKLHTGRPWRDVPARFGPWQTCYSRLRRWQADGTWPRIWVVVAAGEHRSRDDGRGQALGTAAGVTTAGAVLVAAAPPRPPQHLPHRGWRPPHEGDQQPPRLRGRDPDQVRAWRFCAVSRPRACPGGGSGLGADRRQERLGDQHQGHVPIPGVPAADLVVVQANLVLGGLEALLDRPADPGHPDQLGQRGPRRAKAGVEGQLPVRQPPPRQQPEPAARPAWSGQRDPGPVVDPRALGAIPGAEAPPPTGGKAGDQLAGSDLGGTLLAGRPQRRPGGGPPDGRTGGRSARTAARTPPPSSRPRPARPTSTRSAPTLTKRATYPTEVRLQY